MAGDHKVRLRRPPLFLVVFRVLLTVPHSVQSASPPSLGPSMSPGICARVSLRPALPLHQRAYPALLDQLLPIFLHLLTSATDTGDRPYKCQHCGDQFARRYAPSHPAICLAHLPLLAQ